MIALAITCGPNASVPVTSLRGVGCIGVVKDDTVDRPSVDALTT